MNEFSIRKDLPSIKVDKELINQLEKYILVDIPQIIGIESSIIKDKYSIEVDDALGSGKFNSISEFPFQLFQDGTKLVSLGFNIYEEQYCSINISFSISEYSSKISISLKTSNPREKAQGIYNGIMDRINQNKTYNYIFHKAYIGIFGGLGGALITPIISFIIDKRYLLASLTILASILIIIFTLKASSLKPFSEFITQKQIRYNKIFSFFFWGLISYLVFGIGFGLLEDMLI